MKSNTHFFLECRPQLIAVVLGTLNAISDGMQFGWSSPMVPRYQKSEDAPFRLEEEDIKWIEIIYMLAGVLGLPITIYLVNKVGRKKTVLIASSSCIIGWILIAVATNVIYIFVARFMMGIAADIAFISSPMYIAEVAHQKIRGFLSGIIYIMVFTGIVVIYSIGPYVPFYVPSIVGCTILVLQICTFSFMPESPYYLLYKNRKDEAAAALKKLRNSKDVEDELNEIKASIERQKKEEKGRPQDLWLVKGNRSAAVIMTILNGAQHMAGLTVITMNVHLILEAAESIYLTAETSAVLFGSIMLISTIISILMVDKFGRKVLLITSSIFSGLTLLVLATFFHLKFIGVDVSNISWIPVVCVMFFAAMFKIGLGTIPIVMTAELFSAKIKAIGMAYADGVYITFSALSIYLYHILHEYIGIFFPFYIFSFCCFLTGIFTYFIIPETKGKTLEEIQMILKS